MESGATIKIRPIQPKDLTICYLKLLQTLIQNTILRIISKLYMFSEMLRNIRNFDMYCIKRYFVFSGTILIKVNVQTKG